MDPLGWLHGKYNYKPIQQISYKSSIFELELAGVKNKICLPNENGFVISYKDAYNLVADTYLG